MMACKFKEKKKNVRINMSENIDDFVDKLYTLNIRRF